MRRRDGDMKDETLREPDENMRDERRVTYLLICSWKRTAGHVTSVGPDVFLLHLHVLLQTEGIHGDLVVQPTVSRGGRGS